MSDSVQDTCETPTSRLLVSQVIFFSVVNDCNRGEDMEYIVVLLALVFAGWWLFQAGKRLGSRKGYGAGRAGRMRNKPR